MKSIFILYERVKDYADNDCWLENHPRGYFETLKAANQAIEELGGNKDMSFRKNRTSDDFHVISKYDIEEVNFNKII